MDALYASIEESFGKGETFGVILLLSSGIEGPSRTTEVEVMQLARRKGVTIFPVSLGSARHSLLDLLAAETGGVSFKIKEMRKTAGEKPKAIFEAIRSPYLVKLSGSQELYEKFKLEIPGRDKLSISVMTVHRSR